MIRSRVAAAAGAGEMGREETSCPLVSVIIPTHDRYPLVLEAVASVLRQHEQRFELIVVDDGSTDATRSALAARVDVLRYVHQPRRGVATARNVGARLARGGWLAFLDSDDLWRPEKLAAQVAFHQRHPQLLISQTDEIWVRGGAQVNPGAHHRKPQGDIFIPSLARCLVSPSAVMIHRQLFEAVGGFDESLDVCEDYDLWLRIGRRVPVGLVPRQLVIKRGGHSDQLSKRHWGMDRFRVAALVKLLAAGDLSAARRRAVLETLVGKCAVLAQGARRRQRDEEAERYLALARACADV